MSDTAKTIVFVESFLREDTPWNGRIMRESAGVSGTHTSSVYLAEVIATTLGYKVYFLSHGIVEETYQGVHYRNTNHIEDLECDIVITTNNMEDLDDVFRKLHFRGPVTIMPLMNNNLLHSDRLNHFKDQIDKLHPIFPNKTTIENCAYSRCPSLGGSYSIIHHTIDAKELLEPVAVKENAFVFFPCVERGFAIARAVADQFPEFVLYCNTYYNGFRNKLLDPTNSRIQRISDSSSPKQEIYQYLANSKYFVYPLINPENNCIHYDTFGYVILEALVHGVVVLAPRLRIFEEVYGDAICYVDCEDIVRPEVFIHWAQYEQNLGQPMIERYANKIKELEADQEMYADYVKRGLALRTKYAKETITDQVRILFDQGGDSGP
jgi:glycosyltransferase involved in cell wall biosynthesis